MIRYVIWILTWGVIKFGQLGYRHRSLNYSHLQCHSFKLEAKKEAGDAWSDLGSTSHSTFEGR